MKESFLKTQQKIAREKVEINFHPQFKREVIGVDVYEELDEAVEQIIDNVVEEIEERRIKDSEVEELIYESGKEVKNKTTAKIFTISYNQALTDVIAALTK